jgi:hypothetical protein
MAITLTVGLELPHFLKLPISDFLWGLVINTLGTFDSGVDNRSIWTECPLA